MCVIAINCNECIIYIFGILHSYWNLKVKENNTFLYMKLLQIQTTIKPYGYVTKFLLSSYLVIFHGCIPKKLIINLKKTRKKTKLFQNELETCLTKNDNEWKFIVPTKYLETLNIDENQSPHIIRNEYWTFFLQEISKTTKVNWSTYISHLLQNIDQYISLN